MTNDPENSFDRELQDMPTGRRWRATSTTIAR